MTEVLKKTFRYRMFKVVLFLSIPFWFFGGIKGLIFEGQSQLFFLDMTFFLIALISLLLIQFSKYFDEASILFCGSWLVGFVFYWKYLGGVEGPFSYAYFSLLVVFLGILPRAYKVLFVVTLCLLCVVLTLDYSTQNLIKVIPIEQGLINPLGFDYVLNAFILGIVVIYLKKAFEEKRNRLSSQNDSLNDVNLELTIKRQQLVSQQEEIQRIKNNLEELVHDHTMLLEEKNRQLADYAYDNAHIVRAPLSNILGILSILSLKKDTSFDQGKIESIQNSANELDKVIRKINLILK